MMVFVRALGHRGERAAPRALHAPGRRDDPRAVHALHGADHGDTAHHRPPAGARLLHEGEAVEPELLLERRRIAAELAAVDLEAEDAQPVAQPQEADHARVPGHFAPVAAWCEKLPQAPERGRVEPRYHDL